MIGSCFPEMERKLEETFGESIENLRNIMSVSFLFSGVEGVKGRKELQGCCHICRVGFLVLILIGAL